MGKQNRALKTPEKQLFPSNSGIRRLGRARGTYPKPLRFIAFRARLQHDHNNFPFIIARSASQNLRFHRENSTILLPGDIQGSVVVGGCLPMRFPAMLDHCDNAGKPATEQRFWTWETCTTQEHDAHCLCRRNPICMIGRGIIAVFCKLVS